MIQEGDMIDVMEHLLHGREWTIGHVGIVQGPAHIQDFAKEWTNIKPVVREGWWIVSVENRAAKRGYAFATLPGEHLAPHACTSSCPKHLC